MRKLLAAVAAVFLLLGVVQSAQAAGNVTSVISFGYEQTRQRRGESLSWWREMDRDRDAGISYSQPLIIPRPDGSTRVVLMSGNYLSCYVVAGDKVFKPGDDNRAWRTAVNGWESLSEEKRIPSRSHTTYVAEENLLVSGTADGRLVFHDLDTGVREYEPVYLGSPDGVVSAPLVLRWQGELVVVAGGKDGNAYIVTNFKSGSKPNAFPIKIGGIVTSSPGPLPNGEGFIIGSDGAGQVAVVKFAEVLEKGPDGRIRLKNTRQIYKWSDNGRMAGVPASFSMDGWIAYFSDARGSLYALDTQTMTPRWVNRTDFRHANTLINRSPALDERFVYYSIQQNGKKNGAGTLAIVDKNTGKVVQQFTTTGYRLSTAPVVTEDHGVLVGAETGQLHVLGLVTSYDAQSPTWMLYITEDVGQGAQSNAGVILRGLASEISICGDLLVFNTEPGHTYFCRTGATNLYVKAVDLGTDSPEPGATYQGMVTFGVEEKNVPDYVRQVGGVLAPISVTVNGQPVEFTNPSMLRDMTVLFTPIPNVLTLMPGEDVSVPFTWTAPLDKKEIRAVATINPILWNNRRWARLAGEENRYVPLFETTYADNTKEAVLKPLLPDLYVKTLDPSTTVTETGKAYTGEVTFGLKPTYKAPVQAKLTLTHNGYPVPDVSGKIITLQPGQEQSFSFTYHGAGKDSVLYAKIEPVGSDDANWKDNEKQVTVKANRVDLAVSIIKKPSGLYKGEKATYVAKVTSTAAQPITTTVVWSTPGPVPAKRQTITVPAGGSVNTTWSFTMYETDYGVQVPVFAEVNPNRNQPANEIRWDNNKAMCQVKYLTKDQEPPKDPETGPGHLIPGDWYELP